MKRSSRLFLFPDINVWVALSYERHIHHHGARSWFEALPETARVYFCRFTQLGLLRLLSAPAVMGSDGAKGQREAWNAYDCWLEDERVAFLNEPDGLDTYFRDFTRLSQPSPKDWADSYLAAFAQAGRLTIVTFDRGFQRRPGEMMLLPA